ncbi:MAG TPA: SCP2 sterol-binding domain-containing protein [Rhodocyclaceae bacterium]|jgi:putative sterol carrier protein|nr:SCP2 sterol-binding domain-containing protein [Rhodocyclaceae bacterium]
MHKPIRFALALAGGLVSAGAFAAPVMMSAEWAKEACAAWNKDPVLTDKLAESGWVKNDGGKGFKVMQVYRTDCKDSPKVELKIGLKDGKAMCSYGGPAETAALNKSHDYVMHATTQRWTEMGKGEYGPMRAMMFGRLEFEGPKGEAMSNMSPFENFLLLVGKVPSDAGSCPK